jgi:hypothetical protein
LANAVPDQRVRGPRRRRPSSASPPSVIANGAHGEPELLLQQPPPDASGQQYPTFADSATHSLPAPHASVVVGLQVWVQNDSPSTVSQRPVTQDCR